MVFDKLHDEILSLELLPGTKISEADVAARLGVSRQPVRDAFNRLGNLELLSIRPQRATVVRGFSLEQVQNARFVRRAVELEVVRQACAVWDMDRAARLEENLAEQRALVRDGRIDEFHALDYAFHRQIFELSGQGLAFETVRRCKQQVDRLCVLSLKNDREPQEVLADHEEIATALTDRSVQAVEAVMRRHLSRLDGVIEAVHAEHRDYFD